MEIEGIPHIYLSFWKDLMNLSVTDSDVQKCFYTYRQKLMLMSFYRCFKERERESKLSTLKQEAKVFYRRFISI